MFCLWLIFLCMPKLCNQFWVFKHLARRILKIFNIFFSFLFLAIFFFLLSAEFPSRPESFFSFSSSSPAQPGGPVLVGLQPTAKRYARARHHRWIDPTAGTRHLYTVAGGDPGEASDAREVSVSFLVGYPKWKVRCSAAASSLSKDTKVCLP